MSRLSDIIDAVVTRLETITIANGYNTEIGCQVFLNQEALVEETEKPFCVLWTGSVSGSLEGDTPPSQGEENHLMPIQIEAYVEDDERGSQSELARQDLIKALKSDQYFGGLTEGFEGAVLTEIERDEAGDFGFLSVVDVKAVVFFVTSYGEI